ncbi:MAG: hypothetical protein PHE47_01285 [Oscillospiraceae bacterium]|nr:hypothetical protein [Oscillospiraceae bacterium]
MECIIDNKKRLAQVWMSHADQASEEKQEKLRNFIADCRLKKIFVCVYESGDGNLVENTKELLAYNFNNSINRTSKPKSRDDAR